MTFADVRSFLETSLISIAGFEVTIAQVLLVPVVILLGYLLLRGGIRFVVSSLESRGFNADVIQVVRRGVYVVGIIVIVITTLDLLQVPLTAFAFVSGAIAIGFGFGAQNIINNFISGWILMWERPIRINDFIEMADTTGTVEEINTRSTRIKRVDGVHLLVPNSQLLEQVVVNWTLIDRLLRSMVRVGVAYGSDVELVRELLERVGREHEGILETPPVQVIFEDFGDNSLVFDMYFWVETSSERSARQVRSEVRFEINRLFAEHSLVIAYPQRDVHLDGSLRLEQPSVENYDSEKDNG